MVHSLDGYKHQCWLKPNKSGVRSFICGNCGHHMDITGLSIKPLTIVLPRPLAENGAARTRNSTDIGCWCCRWQLCMLCRDISPSGIVLKPIPLWLVLNISTLSSSQLSHSVILSGAAGSQCFGFLLSWRDQLPLTFRKTFPWILKELLHLNFFLSFPK